MKVTLAALLGGLGLLIGLFVLPLAGETVKLREEVDRLARELSERKPPGRDDVAAWEKRRDELTRAYADLARLHAERDRDLEAWLPGATPASTPEEFSRAYDGATREMERHLREAGVEETAFRWTRPDWSQVPEDAQARVLALVQKRFWVARHFAGACAPESAEGRRVRAASRVIDFRFLEALPGAPEEPDAGAPLYAIINAGVESPGLPFAEFELPDAFGRTITFNAAVEIDFTEVPRFVQALTGASRHSRIMINVVAMRLFAAKQNPVALSASIQYDAALPVPDARAESKRLEAKVTPVRATLWLTGQAIDFEPERFGVSR